MTCYKNKVSLKKAKKLVENIEKKSPPLSSTSEIRHKDSNKRLVNKTYI